MRIESRMLAAISLVVLLLLTLLSTTALARVAAPVTITLSSGSALPGDVISISGQDQNPATGDCELVVRKADGKHLDNGVIDGSCAAESDGRILGSFAVPVDLEPTTLTVTVCVSACLDADADVGPAAAELAVETPPDVNPSITVLTDPVRPGGSADFEGQGPAEVDQECVVHVLPEGSDSFLAEDDIDESCSLSASGRIVGSFTVPSNLAEGTWTVSVCASNCDDPDGYFGWLASDSFGVESFPPPSISVTPSPAEQGNVVTITGRDAESAGDGGCDLRVTPVATGEQMRNDAIGGSCSIDSTGLIGGSFTVLQDLQPGELTVVGCVGRCLDVDDPGPPVSVSLVVEPAVEPATETKISVSPNPARPEEAVTIIGTGPAGLGDLRCDLAVIPQGSTTALRNDSIGGDCSIDPKGAIDGSFTVPKDLASGTLTVTVCVADCHSIEGPGTPPASATLIVETVAVPPVEVSISLTPNPAQPGDVVQIAGTGPETAEGKSCTVSLDESKIDAICSIDSVGSISGSFTLVAEVQPGTVTVAVCAPDCAGGDAIHWRGTTSLAVKAATIVMPFVPDPLPRWLLTAVAIIVITIVSAAALIIRSRVLRPRDPRWVEANIRIKLNSTDPLPRVHPFDPHCVDVEIKALVSAVADTVAIAEVQQ